MIKTFQRGKALFIAIVLCSTVLLTNTPTLHAQASFFDLEQEISEKRSAGITVYELYTDDGEIMGYFEPLTDANIMAIAAYAATSSYNWDLNIPSKTSAKGDNVYSFVKGDTISINISQNPSGTGYASYVGLYDRDNGVYGFPENGATTTGWINGILTVGYSGHFSFAIKNASDYTIHYQGTCSF